MKSITIKGSQRESVGKASAKALRNAGKVPCVLYGGEEPLHFSADELAFTKLVYTPDVHTVVIELEDGKKHNAIMQDIQFHPVSDKILHIDFFNLDEDKEVAMDIPVRIVGSSVGVRNGGNLHRNKRKLKVKALPADLPDYIEADISPLKIGSKLYITELENDAYRFLHPDNTVVCQVRRSRATLSIEEEEEDLAEGEETTAEGATAEGEVPPSEKAPTAE